MPFVRYKFESNSQPAELGLRGLDGCICHLLDTSLKAIHNQVEVINWRDRDVYAIC